MSADELTAAPDLAYGQQTDQWRQVNIEFSDWSAAPGVVALRLRPVLARSAADWWYIRKYPHWRLRYRTRNTSSTAAEQLDPALGAVLDALVDSGAARAWNPTIYEPEVLAFGGPVGMRIAHGLFCRDSATTLSLLASVPEPGRDAGRAELSLLALSRLLRAAGLDWYEQGDVWDKVAAVRPASPVTRPPAPQVAVSVRRLLTLDTGPETALSAAGPLTAHRAWFKAFDDTGTQLGALARTGYLTRGLRAILAHHVIFHWNRLALPGDEQHTLATLARYALLPPDGPTR